MAKASRRRRFRPALEGEADVELMPLMNLFIALIPMMLLSAVFVEISVIKMNLPSGDASAADTPPPESLGLTVYILDDVFAVESSKTARRVIERKSADADQELVTTLQEIGATFPENKEIIIGSGPKVLYQDLVHVMDLTRDAGLPQVAFLGIGAN